MLEMDRQRHEGPCAHLSADPVDGRQARFVRQQHADPAIASLFQVKKHTLGGLLKRVGLCSAKHMAIAL